MSERMTKPREQLLQVRCCCQPTRLLGYIPVPAHRVLEGAHVRFKLEPPDVSPRLADPIPRWSVQSPAVEFPITVTLPIERWGTTEFWRLAFKAEETPIDVLRRIPGFIEGSLDPAPAQT